MEPKRYGSSSSTLTGIPAFQRQCLDLMTTAAGQGKASHTDLAYLTDRVLLAEGEPQEYGTQATACDGHYAPRTRPGSRGSGRRSRCDDGGMTETADFAAIPGSRHAAEIARLCDAMEAADEAGRYPRLTVERPWSADNPVLEGEFAAPRAIRWYLERELGRLAASGAQISVSPQSWYARWTQRVLGVPAGHGARLARQLLERLARADVLHTVATEGGGTVFTIPASAVVVSPAWPDEMVAGDNLLTCNVCRTEQPGTATVVAQLDGAPCMLVRCPGTLHREPRTDNYYRRLYASADMRRIV